MRVSAPVYRILRVCLAFILFLSEGTSVFGARDLWSDRQRAVRRVRSGHASSLGQSPWEKLVASFPSVEKGTPLPLPGPTAQTSLPDWLESAVGLYADVGESRLPTKGERRVLIHVQDLHEVEEAQRNTAAVLEQLAASLGGKKGLLVGLEGAAGGFRTSVFRALASPPIIRRTANRFLKAGIISGPEFFSLTTQKPFRLWGVEDAQAYAANIRALTDTFPLQAKDDATVAQAVAHVEKLKEQLYPPALKELDQARTQYEEGRIGLAAYVHKLSQSVPKDSVGPTLRLFLNAVARESDLSLSRVVLDQTRLLETLAPRLNEAEVKQLVETGLANRMGRASFSRFYGLLKRVCSKHNVSLDAYPALVAHAAYVMKAEEINPALLMRDVDTLADRSFKSLLTSPPLVELAALNDDVRLIEKLNRFTLVPEEYQQLVLRRAEIKRWHKRGAVLGAGTPITGMPVRAWPDLSQVMERHKDFYLQAERRNGPLVHNLLSQWGDGSPAVLVAGGYHAEGVRAVAMAQGLGYISLIPRVSSIDNLPPPLESFRSKGNKNEWVFRGDQSGLHRPLPTAEGTSDNQFVARFCAIAASELVAEIGARENHEGSLFVSHLNLALAQMADSARRVGLELTFNVKSVEKNAAGDVVVVVEYSFRDRLSKAETSERVRGSTAVRLKTGDIKVKIDSPSFLSSLLGRWGYADAESAVRRRITWGWEQVSVGSARIVYKLGGYARTTAEILVNPFGHLGINWLAEGVKSWTQNLRLGEDRRVVRVALPEPLGFQMFLLERLAETHREPMKARWEELFLSAFQKFVPAEGKPPVRVISSRKDRHTLTVFGEVGDTPVQIEFGVSKSIALIENPGSHSPFQMYETSKGVFRVLFQMPSVSNDKILPIVMGGVLREITSRLAGESLEAAHASAFTFRERQVLEGHFLAYQLESHGTAMDPEINSSIGMGSYNMGKRTLQLTIPDETININQFVDFTKGQELVRSQLGTRFGIWDTFIEEHHDLWKNILGIKIYARYFELREALFDFFPSFGNTSRLLEQASALVYNRLSSVGAEQGRRASESSDFPNSPDEALVQSVSSQFLPLAQSLLGFLSVSGVSFNQENSADPARFVDQMFRVYAAHFKEGYRQGKGVAASPADLALLSGGVLHLTGSVSQSNAAGQLLKTLVSRSDPTDFKIMVLSDTGEESESIIDDLVTRLESEFAGSPGLTPAIQALRSSDNRVIRNTGAFRVEGAISLEGVLNEFHATWPAMAGVGVFTSQAEAFRQDVESSLLSWSLIDGNGNLVSRAVEDAVFKQAIQAFIRRQA